MLFFDSVVFMLCWAGVLFVLFACCSQTYQSLGANLDDGVQSTIQFLKCTFLEICFCHMLRVSSVSSVVSRIGVM